MCLLMLVSHLTSENRRLFRLLFHTKNQDQTSFTSFAYRWPIWHATKHIVGESFTVNIFTHIFEMNSPENYKRTAIKEHHMFVTKMRKRKGEWTRWQCGNKRRWIRIHTSHTQHSQFGYLNFSHMLRWRRWRSASLHFITFVLFRLHLSSSYRTLCAVNIVVFFIFHLFVDFYTHFIIFYLILMNIEAHHCSPLPVSLTRLCVAYV